MNSVAVVAFGLVGWIVLGALLVERAERGIAMRERVPRPAFVVALAVGVAGLALIARPDAASAAVCGVACVTLVLAAGADARTGYLFDAITLPGALLVAFLALAAGAGSAAIGGVLLLVGCFGLLVLVSRGRWMGLGDVKAMFAVGAAFGPLESLVAIFCSALSALAAAALTSRLQRGAEVRFGPHLAVGATITLLAGDTIVRRLMGT